MKRRALDRYSKAILLKYQNGGDVSVHDEQLERQHGRHLSEQERQFAAHLQEDLCHCKKCTIEGPFLGIEKLRTFLHADPPEADFFEWCHRNSVANKRTSLYCRAQAWQLLGCHRVAAFMFRSARGAIAPCEIETARDLFLSTWKDRLTMRLGHDRAQVNKQNPIIRRQDSQEQTARRRDVIEIILKLISGETKSRRRWQDTPRKEFTWTDRSGARRTTPPLCFTDLDNGLRHQGVDYLRTVNLDGELGAHTWLESGIAFTGMHGPYNQVEASQVIALGTTHNFGAGFPLSPRLDREGYATTSPQAALARQILLSRMRIIENASEFLRLKEAEHSQFSLLMDYCNSITSLMDATLIQAYYRACYGGKEANLRFDIQAMGDTVGRTFDDKIAWLDKMAGAPFRDHEGLSSFNAIRRVRNHLAHFDPPMFACSIDDVVSWLNCAGPIGVLFLRIREHLHCGPTSELLQLALAPDVAPNIMNKEDGYYPQSSESGWESVRWKGGPRARKFILCATKDQRERTEAIHAALDSKFQGERTLEDVWNACVDAGIEAMAKLNPAALIHKTRPRRRSS